MDAFGVEVVGTLAALAAVAVAVVVWLVPSPRQRRRVENEDPQPAIPPPGERRSYLSRGDSLMVTESLYSPDGRTRFTLLDSGNMVVDVADVGDICDTGTTNLGVPKCLTLNDKGWLTLYDVDGHDLWRKGPVGIRLDVQDNSHVVLYPAVGYGDAVWATDTFYKSGQLVHWIPPEQRRTF